jgi:nucleotide-binding universal stress UspA family protein
VLDEAYQYWLMLGPDGVPAELNTRQLEQAVRTQLEEFSVKNLSDVPKLVTKMIMGRPFVEIIQYARDQAIVMIVLATHGRSGLKHVLMGSVAERVVRKAPCPVLSVRPNQHEFVMP